MKEFSAAWREIKSEEIVYPNGIKAKEVFENICTSAKIVRRYNELGNLIYTNERYHQYSWNSKFGELNGSPLFLLQILDFKQKMKYNLWETLREKGKTYNESNRNKK